MDTVRNVVKHSSFHPTPQISVTVHFPSLWAHRSTTPHIMDHVACPKQHKEFNTFKLLTSRYEVLIRTCSLLLFASFTPAKSLKKLFRHFLRATTSQAAPKSTYFNKKNFLEGSRINFIKKISVLETQNYPFI